MEKELTAQTILKAVCDVCGITTEELTGKSRRRKITDARKMAAYLLMDSRACTRIAEVSPLVGLCRNSGYKTVESFDELVRYDPAFRARFQRVCLLIENIKPKKNQTNIN